MTQPQSRRPSRLWRFVKFMTVVVVLFLVALVPAVIFGIPAVARTRWARTRMESALSRVLGTPVTIAGTEASWKKGLTLKDVTAKPANYGTAEVTLAIREVVLKPDYGKLIRRKARAEVVLVAPDIRVHERSEAGSPSNPRLPRLCRRGFRIESLQVREGLLSVRSDRFKDALQLEGVDLQGALAASRDRVDAELSKMTGRLNGGTVTAQGLFAVSAGEARSRIDVSGTGLESNDLLARALRHFLPLFETVPGGSVRGRVDVRVKAEGSGKDVRALLRSARGEGAILVRDGDLRGSRIIEAAGQALGNAGLAGARFLEAEGLLTIRDGKVHLLEALARGPVEVRLSGWTDLDGTQSCAVELAGTPSVVRLGGTLAEPRMEGTPAGVETPR